MDNSDVSQDDNYCVTTLCGAGRCPEETPGVQLLGLPYASLHKIRASHGWQAKSVDLSLPCEGR